ncbi:ornithine cyclodeaminase [Histidinibacterium aquaticum]|uniref:Ornithine cyclodeaminase n=1 Tax=Histidinibacterium aquaticum TaxID=2613962 RepID=A0A5J5GLV9_9RHOB|nr:ornithine cyclodeaminase [Histidinibacterium aquaticum]KAA9009140.1 ornithine cyclodeaminase [Histidinibacterium aquaticum]
MTPPSDRALVPFVSVENMMKLVHHVGIEPLLAALADAIEEDFRRWPEFEKQPRIPAHSEGGVIELMPTTDGNLYGMKYCNGHPRNTKSGLQTVTAFGLLANMHTGYPILLTEMTLLTALRTAAMSALAAKHLAPANAKVMAVIGNGAQCEFQCTAFSAICGIDTVRLYDTDRAATEKAARNLAGRGLSITVCDTAEEAIEGAQIITTVTADKRNATVLTGNMVAPGTHINAVGGDSPGKTEVAADVLHRAGIFVEFPPQTRIEGEIQQLDPDYPVTELWEVMAGKTEGRTDQQQITLFDSVGFAIEDFAALRTLHAYVQETPYHQMIDLLADPDDPRDLFGMLLRASPQAELA